MGGYKFEGRLGRTAPREDEYTFHIAAKNSSGEYSEINSITVQHPGIQQLQLESQDIKGYFSKLRINIPKVFSEISQTVYPNDPTSEEKDIIGYRLHIQEVDYDTLEPIGDEEIINISTEELSSNVYFYDSDAGKKFEIRIGAYDSVYHPDYNPVLYEQTISQAIIGETFKLREPEIPEDLIADSKLTGELRSTINDAHQYSTIINPGDITDNSQAINNNIAKFFGDAITELSADANSGDTIIQVNSLNTGIEKGAKLAISASNISSSAYAIVETTSEVNSGDTSINITSLPTSLSSGAKIKLADEYTASSIKQTNEEITLTVENLNDDSNLANHQYGAIRTTYNQIDLTVGEIESNLQETGDNSPYEGINHNYGQIQINSDRITNTVSQVSTDDAVAILSQKASSGDTSLYFKSGIDVEVRAQSKIYLSDSDVNDNYYVVLEVQSDTSVGSTTMRVESIPTGVEFTSGTGVRIATEYFATQVNQLSDEYTVKIDGYTSGGDPISGGFGISVEGDETQWVDFNVVADKFRVFDTTGDIEGALFGIDTYDSIIYMNANEVQIRGGTESSNESWFQLDDHINMYSADGNFIIDTKQNYYYFGGEVSADVFSLTSDNIVINDNGIAGYNKTARNLSFGLEEDEMQGILHTFTRNWKEDNEFRGRYNPDESYEYEDIVIGTDGEYYVCTTDDSGSTYNEPVEGTNWEDYWEEFNRVVESSLSELNTGAGNYSIEITTTGDGARHTGEGSVVFYIDRDTNHKFNFTYSTNNMSSSFGYFFIRINEEDYDEVLTDVTEQSYEIDFTDQNWGVDDKDLRRHEGMVKIELGIISPDATSWATRRVRIADIEYMSSDDENKGFLISPDGSASFGGHLEAASGTFEGELSAVNDEIQLIQGAKGGVVQIRNDYDNVVTHLGSKRVVASASDDDTGVLVISGQDGIGKSAISVNPPSNYGYITLGNSEVTTEPLSSIEGLYLRGGDDEAGSRITGRHHGNTDDLDRSFDIMSNSGNGARLQLFHPHLDNKLTLGTELGDRGSYILADYGSFNEISADVKNFKIKHPEPDKEDYFLWHSTVESPNEGDNIYRYEIDIDSKEHQLELPSYFKYLNKNAQVFITPSGHFGNAYGEVNENTLTIYADKEGKYNILVIGTRQDESAVNNWKGAERHFNDSIEINLAYDRNEELKEREKERKDLKKRKENYRKKHNK